MVSRPTDGALPEKKAKTATKAANESKTKSKPKAKGMFPLCIYAPSPELMSIPGTRAPSAYNLYMKEHLKSYKDENPGVAQKDAMKAVCTPFSVSSPTSD